MRVCVAVLILVACIFAAAGGCNTQQQKQVDPVFRVSVAYADEPWRKEFDEVCSKTEDTGLSAEELKALIGRCDGLKVRLEGLEDSAKKVYLKRLRMCRDLYEYLLDMKSQQRP